MGFKPYVKTIRECDGIPYLGVFEGQVDVADLADAPKDVEIISIRKRMKNLQLLPNLKRIKCVDAELTEEIVELLGELPKLETVFVSFVRSPAIPNLGGLKKLRFFCARSVTKVKTLDCLAGLGQLQSLLISEWPKLSDISALNELPNLREFVIEGDLHGNTSHVRDISPVFSRSKLEMLTLFIRDAEVVASDFADLPRLKEVALPVRRYPFEFLAELEGILKPKSKRNWVIAREAGECSKCGGTNVQFAGARQREFCPACKPNKLASMKSSYEELSGRRLRIQKSEG